jgi:hypothetical protein
MLSFRVVSAVALALTGLFSLPLAAQTLSAADILAKVEEKVGGVNEYQALLNDPDPARSMAAMEVMLESGDPALVRMALDFGIYSPNPVVQRMALEGFFASGPRLNIYVSGEEARKERNFVVFFSNNRGSIDSAGVGFVDILVGKLNTEKNCYEHADRGDCLIALSDAGAIVFLGGVGLPVKLNDMGELSGEGNLPAVKPPVTLRIPVTN